MKSKDVQEYVRQQISDRWGQSNSHGVNLRTALVSPYKTRMTNRLVQKGKIKDSVVEVWVVLEEEPRGDGYIIFFDENYGNFGLATKGFKTDQYPVICGYYGDFWTTLEGM